MVASRPEIIKKSTIKSLSAKVGAKALTTLELSQGKPTEPNTIKDK
jgi:hypothetical protein